MKTLLVIAIGMQFLTACNSNKNGNMDCTMTSKNEKQIIKTKEDTLQTKANRLKEAFDKKDYANFLKLFPSTFREFNNIYGFDDETGEKPLYSDSEKHVNFLFDSVAIYQKELINKAIGVAKDGRWDADGVNFFQDRLIDLLLKDPNEVLASLSLKSTNEINGFWFFLLDSSFEDKLQNQETYEKLYSTINAIDPKQGALLKKKFKEM